MPNKLCDSPEQTQQEAYRFGYQGDYSEKDEETGWNHFELRQYDPIIGRWMSVDLSRHFVSPYVGMGNNPTNGVDLDGGDVIILNSSGSVDGLGHVGMLVGSDKSGWRYLSKN